jgi:hypothetical protein
MRITLSVGILICFATVLAAQTNEDPADRVRAVITQFASARNAHMEMLPLRDIWKMATSCRVNEIAH